MGTYSASNDIFEGSYNLTIIPDDLATRILYGFKKHWADGKNLLNDIVNNAGQATALGKDYSLEVEFPWALDATTADDVAADLLAFRAILQNKVEFDTAFRILNDDLTAAITVDHFAGPSLANMKIMELNLNLDDMAVTVTAISYP